MRAIRYFTPLMIGIFAYAPSVALAQGLTPPAAPPFNASRSQAPVDVSQFLTQSPAGGGTLVSQVKNAVTADKALLGALIGLASGANSQQQYSIAEGLFLAAKGYLKTDAIFASEIQKQVLASGLPDLMKNYASLSGDTGTGSTGAGGGGGGGGAGGGGPTTSTSPTGGSGSGSQTTGTTPTRNSTPNLLTGGTSSASSSVSSATGS